MNKIQSGINSIKDDLMTDSSNLLNDLFKKYDQLLESDYIAI